MTLISFSKWKARQFLFNTMVFVLEVVYLSVECFVGLLLQTSYCNACFFSFIAVAMQRFLHSPIQINLFCFVATFENQKANGVNSTSKFCPSNFAIDVYFIRQEKGVNLLFPAYLPNKIKKVLSIFPHFLNFSFFRLKERFTFADLRL